MADAGAVSAHATGAMGDAGGASAGAASALAPAAPAAAALAADPLAALEQSLINLPELQQRCVQCLLALSVGDVVGLPFELFSHRFNRSEADEAARRGPAELQRTALQLVLRRVGRGGPENAFARTFSDDTAISDCKLAAIAQFFEMQGRPGFETCPDRDLMQKCFLSQLCAWEFGDSHGALFQGYGGFTKDLLRPAPPPRRGGRDKSFDCQQPPLGCRTWPTEWFLEHFQNACVGASGSPPSWGNGTCMSFAPPVVADELLARAGQPPVGEDVLSVFRAMHSHQHALLAADLLEAVLRPCLRGEIASTSQLKAHVKASAAWAQIVGREALLQHQAYPIAAFDEWLSSPDCTEDSALSFILRLTGDPNPTLAPPPQAAYAVGSDPAAGSQMGRLFRTASNWDDRDGDHERLELPSGEMIRFSQRGLNSVLVAIWCVADAQCCWDWMARLLYVGGDADTIGAVAGQIAGPLLPTHDVCRAFRRFVALGDCERRRPCAEVVAAAATRFFERALAFCQLRWPELSRLPRLSDPGYDCTRTSQTRGWKATGERWLLRVLWLDGALAPARPRSAGRGGGPPAADAGKGGGRPPSSSYRVARVDEDYTAHVEEQRGGRGGASSSRPPGRAANAGGGDRASRAAVARRDFVQDLLRRGHELGVELETHHSRDAALERLQLSRYAPAEVPPFDVLVLQQDLGGDPTTGPAVWQTVLDLWRDDELGTPQVVLLTPWFDANIKRMAEDTASCLRRKANLVRHDKIDAIHGALVKASCLPASLPPDLRPLPGPARL